MADRAQDFDPIPQRFEKKERKALTSNSPLGMTVEYLTRFVLFREVTALVCLSVSVTHFNLSRQIPNAYKVDIGLLSDRLVE